MSLAEVEYLKVKEACTLLRISRNELYRAVHSGRLPVIRLGKQGRSWRIVRADLLKLREALA